MFIVYAHRGASEYSPENTLASFYLGAQMGANGIETDVSLTKDGVLVLFHDKTLKRITGEDIAVSDITYRELLERDIGAYKGDEFKGERAVSYEDFLRYFAGKDLAFAVEVKAPGVEEGVVEGLYRFGAQRKSVVTSFMLDSLTKIRSFDRDIPLGYLSKTFDLTVIDECLALGLNEICPEAPLAEKPLVDYAKAKGLRVRAWGVKTAEHMNRCLDAGVDGMTVNFPDRLIKELGRRARR